MNIEVKNSQKPVDYNESMKILEKRVDDVFKGKSKELLWILEHNTIYTAGTSSVESDVLDKDTKIIKSTRGGKHTLHSPGQKVVYFVLNLNKRKKDIRQLIRNIEKCIIVTLKHFKILPIYKVISNTGPRHKPNFKVGVKLKNTKFIFSNGSSKKNAEQSAAKELLKTLNQ